LELYGNNSMNLFPYDFNKFMELSLALLFGQDLEYFLNYIMRV